MNLFEALRIAGNGLLANRLRSALTTLGILIGVTAVILLVAVGNGASVQINNQVQSLGANVIYVYPSNARGTGGVSQGFGTGQTLTQADVDAINNRQQAADVVAAIPIAQSGGQITYGNQNYFAPTTGTTPAFPTVRNYTLAQGSFFTDDDVNARHRVVVLGQTVARPIRSARRSRSAARASASSASSRARAAPDWARRTTSWWHPSRRFGPT